MAQNDDTPPDGPDRVERDLPAEPASPLEADESGHVDDPPLLPRREPMRTIFRVVGMLEQVVGSLLLILILILVLAQVAQRYVPGAWPWTGELARLSMVWATFLLAGYLFAYAPRHITILVIDYVAKGRWLAAVKLFVNVVILATCLFMIYASYTLVTTAVAQVTPAGGWSLRFVNSIPLVGLILVVVRIVLAIVMQDIPALRGRNGDAA